MEIGLSSESFMGQTLAVITGAILGTVIHRILGELNWDMTLEGIPITGRDIVVFTVSILLIMFGGKVSTYLKYAGAGMLAWQLGHEITDVLWV